MAGCEARHFFSDYFDFFEKSLLYSISFLYICKSIKNSNIMKIAKLTILGVLTLVLFVSCSPSVTSNLVRGADLSKYKYVVWPMETTGDQGLGYALFDAYSFMTETRLKVISEDDQIYYPRSETLISHCHVSQNVRESLVSIDFKDAVTGLPILYVKGSYGMGSSLSEDMEGALRGLKRELLKYFPSE